jgi:hypothetical protein
MKRFLDILTKESLHRVNFMLQIMKRCRQRKPTKFQGGLEGLSISLCARPKTNVLDSQPENYAAHSILEEIVVLAQLSELGSCSLFCCPER